MKQLREMSMKKNIFYVLKIIKSDE